MNDVEKIFEDVKICKLDIKRIYRYLDKNVKKDTSASKKSYLENEEEEDEVEIAEDDYDCDE